MASITIATIVVVTNVKVSKGENFHGYHTAKASSYICFYLLQKTVL